MALSMIGLALLALGYGASQIAILRGDPASYAARVDTPPVKFLALALLVAAIILSLIPDRDQVERH